MNSARTSARQRGFTLLELLVCLVIVITLAALVFTGFRKIRSAADRTRALATVRQLQFANHSYANDHNGRYVPISSRDENNNRINDWHENPTFHQYLLGTSGIDLAKPSKKVPDGILDPVVVRAKKRQWDRLYSSYGYNEVDMPGSGPVSDKSFRVGQLTDPTRTMAFATATDWIVKYPGRFLWLTQPAEGKTTDGKMAFRHGGKAIVVFYDGSSGLVSPDDLRRIDRQGAMANPFWKADFR